MSNPDDSREITPGRPAFHKVGQARVGATLVALFTQDMNNAG